MIEKICKIISNKTAKFPLGFGEKCITWLNGWRMIGHRDGYGMNRWRRQVDCNDNTLGIKTPAWSLIKKQEFSLHTHPDSTLTKKGDYSRGILCIICLWPNNRISSIDSWRTQTARFKRPFVWTPETILKKQKHINWRYLCSSKTQYKKMKTFILQNTVNE